MSSDSYQIVFRGRLAPGADEAEVKANLGKLFKIDAARVESLFSPGRKVLKQGLSREQADRYREVLRQAGARVAVVSAEARSAAAEAFKPAPKSPEAPAERAVFVIDDSSPEQVPTHAPTSDGAPAKPATFRVDDPTSGSAESTGQSESEDPGGPIVEEVARATLAPPGTQLIKPVILSAPEIHIEGLDLAEVGATFDESRPPPPPALELGDLSVSEDFDHLDESPRPPEPQIEFFDLDLADPDTIVDDTEPPAPREFDTGSMSASDEYEALDEHRPAPVREIDTSHLELEDD